MVNAKLSPVATMSSHQPLENLKHTNLLPLAIPQTEDMNTYNKMREGKEREQVAEQSHQITSKVFMDEKQQEEKMGYFHQRRDFFFASKLKLSHHEVEKLSVELVGISDYKQVMSIIEKKYLNAVSPISLPSLSDDI